MSGKVNVISTLRKFRGVPVQANFGAGQSRDIFRGSQLKNLVLANRSIENYIQIFTWHVKLELALQNKHFVPQIDSYIKAHLPPKINSNDILME